MQSGALDHGTFYVWAMICSMHSITTLQCLNFPILAFSSTHPTTPVSTLQTAVLEDQFTLPDGTVTLAEPRPNAYIPQSDTELPLPKPYGSQAPFKPSQPGATMRHIRKPVPKPIDIWFQYTLDVVIVSHTRIHKHKMCIVCLLLTVYGLPNTHSMP